jgi:tetratricopeptide (TPR) repeat protein
MGQAYGGLGDKAKALEFYRQASGQEGAGREQPEMLYYRGRAALELGQLEEAGGLFDTLMAAGQKALTASEADFFAKFGQERSSNLRLADGHYLMGLAYLGKGDAGKAGSEFDEALKLNASHLGAASRR